eukprot:7358359-Pyramimonas_sp.AAC.1
MRVKSEPRRVKSEPGRVNSGPVGHGWYEGERSSRSSSHPGQWLPSDAVQPITSRTVAAVGCGTAHHTPD